MNKTTEAFEAWWSDTGEQSLFALNTTTDDDIKILAGLAWEAAIREAVAEPVKQEQESVVYYAYATIKEYEELAGFSVSQAFRAGWNMARTTNSMLGINAAPVQPVKQEPVAKVTDVFPTRVEWLREVAVNSLLYAAPVSAEAIRAEALKEAAKVCEKAMIQMNYSEAPYKQCAAAIRGLK